MTPSETEYGLLVRLAWELRPHGIDSYVLVRSESGPHMYVSGRRGQQDVIEGVVRGERWYLVWRGVDLDTSDIPAAARTIALGAAA